MRDKYEDLKKIYRFDKDSNSYNIDIGIDFYRDLYSDWDFAPIHNRDIDGDLMDFIEDCSREIPVSSGICINFFLPKKMYNKKREEKSIIGLKNFFNYSIRGLLFKRREMIQSTIIYGTIGSLFLILGFFLQSVLTNVFLSEFLPEGLFIGGWVLIWEIFSIIFFQLRSLGKRIKSYKRLLDSKILYNYT